MNTSCEFVHFTPADESVKLHWAITGMLSRMYDAKYAYGVSFGDSSIDVYFATRYESFYRPGDTKAIWVDTRPSVMRANNNLPLIFWSSAVSVDLIRGLIEDPGGNKNLAAIYLSVLMTLKQDNYFKAVNANVWKEYEKMYPGLEPDFPCNCKDCQEERKEKEIDALILPILNHLKKRIREEIEEKKKPEGCECSRDEYCSCQP